MTFEQLITLTRTKMEEFSPFNDDALIAIPQITGFEDKPVTSYIEKNMEEAANSVLMMLPLRLIVPEDIAIGTKTINKDGSGSVEIGDDYLRLHSFKMKSWEKEVNFAIDETHPLYILQDNPYTMGNSYKPVVVFKQNSYTKELRYYSCPRRDKTHDIEYARQVTRFNKYNIQDSLAEFYATKCAELVYKIYGMADNATIMQVELDKMIATR